MQHLFRRLATGNCIGYGYDFYSTIPIPGPTWSVFRLPFSIDSPLFLPKSTGNCNAYTDR
jgi:hypothetical protein